MNITDIFSVPSKSGEVGIEIEVEGNSLPESIVGWIKTEDGSLRGESCEYVLRQPCKRDRVDSYLDRVSKAYADCNTDVYESARQSIHVHINVQDLSLTEIYNFIILFLIYETPLVDFCGEERGGNLFCLRSSDAEFLLTKLEEAAAPSVFHTLNSDSLRYSALNVVSLFKYGSLEFRSMRGTADFVVVKQWINLLLSLKDYAKCFNNPVDILENYRSLGVARFTDDVFGSLSTILTADPSWSYEVKMGMRRIQPIAYRGDWDGLSDSVRARGSSAEDTSTVLNPSDFESFAMYAQAHTRLRREATRREEAIPHPVPMPTIHFTLSDLEDEELELIEDEEELDI